LSPALVLLALLPVTAPPKPAATVWVEAETAAASDFHPGVVEAPGAYAGKALRLDTDRPAPEPYHCDLAVSVPATAQYELRVCATRLDAAETSPLALRVDGGGRYLLSATPQLGPTWPSQTDPPWVPRFAWHSFGLFHLAAGNHTLRFEVLGPGSAGRLTVALDALCLIALPEPKLLFHAPYDESLEPAVGRAPAFLTGDAPLGPGHDGRAVRINEGVVLEYSTAANLDPAAGTVAFWFSFIEPPEGRAFWDRLWDLTVGGSNDNAMRILLQKDAGRVYAVLSSTAGDAPYRFSPTANTAIAAGEWHHAALTWGPRGAALWLDARLVGASDQYRPPAGLPERFTVGNIADSTAGARAWVDDLRIYDQPLEAAAVRALAGLEAPAASPDANLLPNAGFELGQAG